LGEFIQIKSGQGDYLVRFFNELQAIVEIIKGLSNVVLVIDEKVADIYPQFNSLKNKLLINAIESEKTLDGVSKVLDFLQSNNCTKESVVVAVGGGIIQDIVTFASHIYYRGIKWIFVPTTLLAMCDSCIGAKCGINHNDYKNQLGIFHAPSQVLVYPKFIDTLTEKDIHSGCGEILKLMLIGSEELFYKLNKEGFASPSDFILSSLVVKKKIIEIDEYEKDLRRILNYGHTFGHSLEAVAHYEIPHGLAVVWGIDVANYISLYKGMMSSLDFNKIHRFIEKHFSYGISHKLTVMDLINGTKRDKKLVNGKLNMVLLQKIGDFKIVPIEFDRTLENIVSEYVRDYSVYRD
jgi:3-dehydroquinate synthase